MAKAIDDGKYTGAVFLDLTKAFDTVYLEILCSKLHHYGFNLEEHLMTC